jgi:hypothetical protein
LPDAVEGVEQLGPVEIAELWLLARAYSRLRHRTSPRRQPERRQRFEALKVHCISLAVARSPQAFLVFVDPGFRHLVVIYHRVDRTLLHLPKAVWCQLVREATEANRSRAPRDEILEKAAVA